MGKQLQSNIQQLKYEINCNFSIPYSIYQWIQVE